MKNRLFGILLAIGMMFSLFTSVNASIDPSYTYGDINSDNQINAVDALMAMRFSVGKLQLDNRLFTYSDVNMDGEVHSADALIILEFSTGVVSSLPVPLPPVGVGCATPVNPSTLPEYNDLPYVYVNNGMPNFSSEELITNGYENYGPLDSQSRCTAATACCCKEIMPAEGEQRGNISSVIPTGWVQAQYDFISGKYLYNRCHLIGWQLSAENANKQNLITGTKYLNVSGMLPFENLVADHIKETGHHVAYRATPIFENNNLLASGVQIEAYSIEDRGTAISFNVYCYNVQPNVVLDYSTGSSTPKPTPD